MMKHGDLLRERIATEAKWREWKLYQWDQYHAANATQDMILWSDADAGSQSRAGWLDYDALAIDLLVLALGR